MRLLLDEQLSPVVAQQLRKRGHDVVGVAEVGMAGSEDDAVLRYAMDNKRTLVTSDIRDFRALHARSLTLGTAHYGIVLVPHRYRLRRAGIGALVKDLDSLLARLPAIDALRDLEIVL